MGYSYYRINDVQKALRNCNASLKLNPDNSKLQKFVDEIQAQNLPAPAVQDSQNNSENISTLPLPDFGNKSKEAINSFYFNIGTATPFYPAFFSGGWNTGLNIGVGYGFGISRTFSLVLDAHYNGFPSSYGSWDIYVISILANAKLNIVNRDNPVVLYGIIGLGPCESGLPGYSETDFMFRLGLGIDIKIDKALYLYIETNGIDDFSSLVSLNGYMTSNMFSIGMKFDNN